MKIAFFELEQWEKQYIEDKLKGHEIVFFDKKISEADFNKFNDCDALAIFIYSKINKEILDKLKNLKLITTMSTGFDHIDVEEAKKRKIAVCNVPTYGENTVAEHTFALILAISRKIPQSLERTKKGDFTLENLMGFDLKGKTIGIIGCGNIGKHVARIANGFEMNILVFDVKKEENIAKDLNFKYVGFDYLLSNSDIITLHAPLNSHTKHMINKENINLIKKKSVLINTARGGLIETNALIDALKKGILGAVALDVLEEECFIKEEKQLLSKEFPKECDLKTVLQQHILLTQDNVFITPHNAFNSKEALLRIINVTIQNIAAFSQGKPINIV